MSGDEVPVCSVVVPTYNRRDGLSDLLDHLTRLAATGRVEVIVVDDGSSDGTSELLASHDTIRSVSQANAGPAAARNRGLSLATGRFVAFTDDDCAPSADWPLGLLGAFDDPEVGGVGGGVRPMRSTTLDLFVVLERQVDHGAELPDGGVDYLITANAVFRRELLQELGGFDEGFGAPAGEDVDLSWRVRAAGHRLETRAEPHVLHDHRATLKGVLQTYRKHGWGRSQLRDRHPADSLASASARAVSPSSVKARWVRYRREGASVFMALGFSALRLVGLGAYMVGLVQARLGRQ